MTKLSLVTFGIICLLVSACLSCSTLSSTTYIKANDAFILGNNEHGVFKITLTNESPSELILWKSPIAGGNHSPVTIQPKESLKLTVEKNTALRIENPSKGEATVKLLVKGDTGLSMGYKNQEHYPPFEQSFKMSVIYCG